MKLKPEVVDENFYSEEFSKEVEMSIAKIKLSIEVERQKLKIDDIIRSPEDAIILTKIVCL